MQRRDYYVVLGIRRDESPAGVRSAFRDLARRYHPDRAGPAAARFFRELVEAYYVLSDTERRASYDRGLEHGEPSSPHLGTAVTAPPVPLRPEPEPLVPETVSILHDFHVTRPSYDEVFERFFRNFARSKPRTPRAMEPLRLQVIIGREQAMRGGALTLGVPVFYPCIRCHGTGGLGAIACESCDGVGLVQEQEPLAVHVPSGVRDGTILELPLRGVGIHDMYIELMVRVAD
jgi:DnaJ-class molecular chaperone